MRPSSGSAGTTLARNPVGTLLGTVNPKWPESVSDHRGPPEKPESTSPSPGLQQKDCRPAQHLSANSERPLHDRHLPSIPKMPDTQIVSSQVIFEIGARLASKPFLRGTLRSNSVRVTCFRSWTRSEKRDSISAEDPCDETVSVRSAHEAHPAPAGRFRG